MEAERHVGGQDSGLRLNGGHRRKRDSNSDKLSNSVFHFDLL
jgi:hypothetical protein